MKNYAKQAITLILFLLIVSFNYSFAGILKDGGSFPFETSEGKAYIVFPCNYTITDDIQDESATYKIQASCDDNLFFFAYTIHENEMTDHYEMAKVSIDSFHGVVGGEITSQEDFMIGDYKGVKAVISNPGITMYYRVVLVGQIQYQIVVADATGNIDKEMEDFFASFQLTE